jgi:hypothetical protein
MCMHVEGLQAAALSFRILSEYGTLAETDLRCFSLLEMPVLPALYSLSLS